MSGLPAVASSALLMTSRGRTKLRRAVPANAGWSRPCSVTYWGTLAIAGANVLDLHHDGAAARPSSRAEGTSSALHDEDSTTVDAAQIVGIPLPGQPPAGQSRPRGGHRERPSSPCCRVKVAKGGRYIRRSTPGGDRAKSRNRHGETPKNRTPTGMIDECAMAQPAPAPPGHAGMGRSRAPGVRAAAEGAKSKSHAWHRVAHRRRNWWWVAPYCCSAYGVLAAKGGPSPAWRAGDSPLCQPWSAVESALAVDGLIVGGIALFDQGPARGLRR